MFDHAFTDAIGALRDALEAALLERITIEERLHSDVLLGDLSWETSYGLPGEGKPARTRADITLLWPTWSQAAYRSWYLGEDTVDAPHIDIEVVFRIQQLSDPPSPRRIMVPLPGQGPAVGSERLHRSGPTIEEEFSADLESSTFAVEISYEGCYDFTDEVLADASRLDHDFAEIGSWIASALVRLGDSSLQQMTSEDR